MEYNFDRIIERKNSYCVKWDGIERIYGSNDILPMWIADMDYCSPNEVIEALKLRVEHGIFGYTELMTSFYDAIINWFFKRYQWKIEKEWIICTPGVNVAASMAVKALTFPGDKIIIQSPLYDRLTKVVQNNDRMIVNNGLKLDNGRYVVDFEDLEQKLKADAKLMILCSPHNPVGRVWTREELEKTTELCHKYGVIVISDEIHSDIVYKGHKHIPFACISEKYVMNSLTCIAPSKTFNIAGLTTSIVIIPDPEKRKKISTAIKKTGIESANIFDVVALEAAYNHGEKWLSELLDYLQENIEIIMDYFKNRIPSIKPLYPEGTYLMWLDCHGMQIEQSKLLEFLVKAKIAVTNGKVFGPGGEGFLRMNIACPRSILLDGLKRIEEATGKCRSCCM